MAALSRRIDVGVVGMADKCSISQANVPTMVSPKVMKITKQNSVGTEKLRIIDFTAQ